MSATDVPEFLLSLFKENYHKISPSLIFSLLHISCTVGTAAPNKGQSPFMHSLLHTPTIFLPETLEIFSLTHYQFSALPTFLPGVTWS